MTRRSHAAALRLVQRLSVDPVGRLVRRADGDFELSTGAAGAPPRFDAGLVRPLLASGLLREAEPGRLAVAPVAGAWLKRQSDSDAPFRDQHGGIERATLAGQERASVLVNREESPIAALARRSGKSGEPWLAADTVAAGERLRRDFEVGNLQPRVTANWSASVNTGRRAEAGLADLTEAALSARLRFDRAMRAVGPEFSGILIDVCCFLKGLETVERERQWPARSAKLVLRLALQGLARHYGLAASATGKQTAGRVRHWGAEGYRPEIS